MKPTLPVLAILLMPFFALAQPCSPAGDQTSFGTGNLWIGYVYDNLDLTGYMGYVNEGNPGSPNFNQNFGGENVTYATNGCPVQTSTFSVRYKLTMNFTAGNYDITIGGDDGHRLSIDGGSTWLIDRWSDQSYNVTTATVALNGSYDFVLEYYENQGGNQISFNIALACNGTENTNSYGTGNVWRGYIYDGTNFNSYKGMVMVGNPGTSNFDEQFGGSNILYNTSACAVQTETFSARYRLNKTFPPGTYRFIVGGDDGYRLSLDGGSTWAINNWGDHGYATTELSLSMSGNYNLVLEYYENGGDNRISMFTETLSVLPVRLLFFTGEERNNAMVLDWGITPDSDPDHFIIERSRDAINYSTLARVDATQGINNGTRLNFSFQDASPPPGDVYYRLRMVDLSGTVTYSRIVHIGRGTSTVDGNALAVFPTLVSNRSLFLKSGRALTAVSVKLHDMSGRLLHTQDISRVEANRVISLFPGLAKVPGGTYFVSISEGGRPLFTQRVIIP